MYVEQFKRLKSHAISFGINMSISRKFIVLHPCFQSFSQEAATVISKFKKTIVILVLSL